MYTEHGGAIGPVGWAPPTVGVYFPSIFRLIAVTTAPLIGFYKKEGLLFDVNATSSDTVVNAIKRKIDGK